MHDGDPYERCFEEVLNRFDRMLSRVNRERDEKNRAADCGSRVEFQGEPRTTRLSDCEGGTSVGCTPEYGRHTVFHTSSQYETASARLT